ncbi:hypothetical protein WJX79_005606 [Trebouxia sp. C0005]
MKLVWPTYGLREENKKYTDNFRMDKQTYEMLHNEVKDAISKFHVILHETVDELDKALYGRVVKWPTERELPRIMADLEHLNYLPQCAGAIDGSFIHMPEPPSGHLQRSTIATREDMPSFYWLLLMQWEGSCIALLGSLPQLATVQPFADVT